MRRPELPVAVALVLSTLAGLGLTVVYVLGGHPQVEGALLAVALGGLGGALIAWGKGLLPEEELVEPRERGPSPEPERQALGDALGRGGEALARRRLLVRLLAAAAGALGLAALFPIRSLGPSPGRTLFHTSWRRGSLVVTEDGTPVAAGDLPVGSVLTVFPQGHEGSSDSQALLIRVDPGLLRLPEDREAWAPDGHVAYSKICTHAGCPVGLYRARTHQLLCPCHQSTFDVLRGAVPVFGPAARPLPQLPLEIGGDGRLRALGDFTVPAGPSFWELHRG